MIDMDMTTVKFTQVQNALVQNTDLLTVSLKISTIIVVIAIIT